MNSKASKHLSMVVIAALCACLFASAGHAVDPSPLASANQAFEQRELALAKEFYRQHYQQRGTINDTSEQKEANTRAIMRLGHCCLGLEQYAEARDWFARAMALRTDDAKVRARAQCSLAIACAGQGLTDLAIQNIDQVIAAYPQQRMACASALLNIAELHTGAGRFGEGIETLHRLLRDFPSSRGVCKKAKPLLVRALDGNLRINDSLRLVDELLASDEYDAEEKGVLLVTRADIQLGASRFTDCKETCQRILGDSASSESAVRGARRTLIQALCEDGTDPDKALALIEEMSKEAKAAAYRDPSSEAHLALWRGGAYWIRGDHAKAEECFTKVISDFPDQTAIVGEAYLHRARLRATALKAYDKAAADIEQISVPYLKHYARGELLMSQKQYASAAAEYEQVISNLPARRVSNTEPVLALKRLIRCYDALGRTDDAARCRILQTDYERTHK